MESKTSRCFSGRRVLSFSKIDCRCYRLPVLVYQLRPSGASRLFRFLPDKTSAVRRPTGCDVHPHLIKECCRIIRGPAWCCVPKSSADKACVEIFEHDAILLDAIRAKRLAEVLDRPEDVSAPCFCHSSFPIRGLRVVERGRRHDISGSGDKSIELRRKPTSGLKVVTPSP